MEESLLSRWRVPFALTMRIYDIVWNDTETLPIIEERTKICGEILKCGYMLFLDKNGIKYEDLLTTEAEPLEATPPPSVIPVLDEEAQDPNYRLDFSVQPEEVETET